MRVLLANPRGFCAGVNMAIDCVNQVLELASLYAAGGDLLNHRQ